MQAAPAEQVTSGPYEVGVLQSPVLTGWKLRAICTATQWLDLSLIRERIYRASNIPQVLVEIDYPEFPTFRPIHTYTKNINSDDFIQLSQTNLLQRINSVINSLPQIEDQNIFPFPSIRAYNEAYKNKKTDPVKVAEFILKKLDGLDKQKQPMQWMQDFHKQNVLNSAEESRSRWQNGKSISVFDGVPFAVKDNIDALPYKSFAGTTFLGDKRKVEEDDPAVAALKSLGAILIGKTTLHELGLGTTGVNAQMGTAKNPYDPDFMTGGSSSGSAAIVASGLVPFAMGTDGGGSIRIPAAFCGVFGLKPQFGRFSSGGLVADYSNGCKGPLCGTAEDTALVYAACCNQNVENAENAAPIYINKTLEQLQKNWTIGFYRDWFNHADEIVVAKCKHVLNLLTNIGVALKTITIPELEQQRVAHSVTISSEITTQQTQYSSDPITRSQLNADTQMLFWGAKHFTAQFYLQAQKIRTRSIIHFERIFQEVDFIVSPTVPTPAHRLEPEMLECGESNLARTTTINRFAYCANFCGYPAISIPVGTSFEGLPIGIQFMGKAWREHELLNLAMVLEKEMRRDGLIMERPKISFNPLEN